MERFSISLLANYKFVAIHSLSEELRLEKVVCAQSALNVGAGSGLVMKVQISSPGFLSVHLLLN